MDKRKLYLDMDQTCINSIKRVVELYNQDFANHQNFVPARWCYVNQWDFKDECKLISKQQSDAYFEDERFFDDKLEFMDNGEELIRELSKEFDIHIVSMGTKRNAELKSIWIKQHMPYVKEFIGVDMSVYKDKSHIIMGDDSIFIDDVYNNLVSADCCLSILYGDCYEWNSKNEERGNHAKFRRCWNWNECFEFLMS